MSVPGRAPEDPAQFHYQGLCAVLSFVTQSCPTLCNPMDCNPPGSSVHGDALGKNSHAMPSSRGSSQPEIEPRSPTLQVDSLPPEPPVKPKNTGVRVAHPFFRGSSRPRNWTRVSCIAGRFFTSWATREAHQGLTITAQVFCIVSQWGVPLQGVQDYSQFPASCPKWSEDISFVLLIIKTIAT